MKKIWFWKFIFVCLFVMTLSGCKVVMDYHLDDCDPTTAIIDSSDTSNDAVLKHGTGNTDGLSARYSFDTSSYIICANRWFRGEGYNAAPNNSWYAARYYIEAPDHDDISPLASSSKEMTLSGWFKTSRSNGTIIAKSGDSSDSKEYRVFLEGGTLKVSFWNQYGSPVTFDIAPSVADNAWHAFAVTAQISGSFFSGNNLLVEKYLDGDFKGTETSQGFTYCTNTSGPLFIGAMAWSSANITDYFDGYIDELLMVDEVQSQNDLRAAYQEMAAHNNSDGSNRPCLCSIVSPLAEYRFEGCDWTTGAVVSDEMGNYPGTVVQGAHTAPGTDFGGGLCNVANLQDEDTDYDRHISLTGNPIPLNGDWTLMMWINFPPGFDRHFQYGGYRYSVIAGGTHDLAWIREHTTNGTRYWGASSDPNAHLAPFPSTLTGWHHLAFVGNGTNTDLYVDGAFYNTVDYKQTGSYTRMGTTADSVHTNARQNLDTQLDELKFYDGALSAAEISSIYGLENSGFRWDGSALNCNLCGMVDHYRIEHTGFGLTCQRSDVTLRACSNATCSAEYAYPVTVTLSPVTANPPSWIGGDRQSFTGHQDFQLRQTLPATLSLGLTNPDHVPTNGVRCYDSGVEGDCDIDFFDTGFIFDVPDLTSCQPSPSISIQAVRTDNTTQTCVADAGFAGANKTVNFWSAYVNPVAGTEQVSLGGTTIATASPGTGISLNFDANATANFTVTYPDAGQMQLDARYVGVGTEEAGLVMLGSDIFVTRPVGLCVYSDETNAGCASGNGSCSVFHKVDENFNLKVKGVCWEASGDTDFCNGNSTTQNFQLDSIPISHNLIAPSGTGVSAGSIGVASIDITAADNGEHVINNQTVSEVGVYTFTATPPNYFGIVLPAATSDNIGRFTPDHFVTSVTNNGVFQDACSGFSYSGQMFSYASPNYPEMLITAVGSSGNTTVNYRDDFVKLTNPATQISMSAVTADSSHNGALANPLALTWAPAPSSLTQNNDGTLNFVLGDDQFTYTREANALVAPFTTDVQLPVTAITDSDGISATGLPSSFSPTGTEIRYGRLVLQNAYGPETLPLTIPLSAEFYNGAAFVPNDSDSCTAYNSTGLSPLSPISVGGGQTVASGSGTLDSGKSNVVGANSLLSLSAPGAGNVGSINLVYNLSGLQWLQFDWNGDGSEDNPTARATFGIFRGNQRLIYMRESVW